MVQVGRAAAAQAREDAAHGKVSWEWVGAEIGAALPWTTTKADREHHIAEVLVEQRRGGAVVLTSLASGVTGRGGDGTDGTDGYVASKHGVVGLMRTWANWLVPHAIRVNCVNPSGVATPMVLNNAVAALFGEGTPTAPPKPTEDVANLIDVTLIDVGFLAR